MAYKIVLNCLKFIFTALVLLILQPVQAQRKQQPLTTKYNFSELDKILEEKQKLLGGDFAVLLWKKDDTLVYKKEFGELKTRTVVPIASCSKWLTTALIMQLVDEGKISLDDPVVNYLPVFEKYMKKYITIRHCLSHMTGIDDEGRLLKKLFERKKFESLDDEVNAFAAREIRANAGTDFWYGNIGLNIAARVAEVVTKRKFDQLIRQKLFIPVGMRQTSFSTLDGSPPNPSGGARSTAEDYMRFLVMLMNKGKINGKQVLSEESVEEMMKIQTANIPKNYVPKAAEGFQYALGSWVLESPQLNSPFPGGVATTLACPGLFGTWPMIDFCRGYAYILIVKDFLGEERADAEMEIKKVIDGEIKVNCE